ncbi:MAG: Bro-N domain-containing protein [Bacteroidales bacterium]|nr:Bro-N domain-containing protein [Bacteroidales bacterium]
MEKVQIFQDKRVRTHWDAEQEEWYFSVVDVVAVLTDNGYQLARNYWKVLKHRMSKEGNETVTNCNQLKMRTPDGKMRLTDVADTKQLLRIIQSIPSPEAEPFKQWLTQVGAERLDEIADPERAIVRGADFYRAKGYSEGWINQRLQSIEMRKELTDELDRLQGECKTELVRVLPNWKEEDEVKARGIDQERDYAILTNEMTRAWSGLSVRDYKEVKGLKKENLRDNMTNLELVLNMLAEVKKVPVELSIAKRRTKTTAISRSRQPETFSESRNIAIEGGNVAGSARREIEQRTGQPVVSPLNAQDKLALDTTMEEARQIELNSREERSRE